MKVLHVSTYDMFGGAARAAYRVHRALITIGVDSKMYVTNATSQDPTVVGPASPISKVMQMVRTNIGFRFTKLQQTGNSILHSPALLSSDWVQRINQSDADIVNLHWICGEMMSIEDIGRISKPIVWRLPDMWAFCGAEHYTQEERYRQGYTSSNRPSYESGFDLNRFTWNRKRRAWKRPMQIVTPSRWLGDCVNHSKLMQGWPVQVIPNCLNIERWQPLEQQIARRLLSLPEDVPLLMFGAFGGGDSQPIKGFDLLLAALNQLRGQIPKLEIVVFGEMRPRHVPDVGYPIHYTGHLYDDMSLRIVYSAADAMVVPSRQEAFGQTASEALACGTPVIAFDATGPRDIVIHQQTGWLAPPYDTQKLAEGIQWILADPARRIALGKQARESAVTRFAEPVVANQYLQLYESVLAKWQQ